MKSTYHSEYLKLQSVFINPVENAFVSQTKLDADWKRLNYLEQPNFNKAIEEYEAFEALFLKSEIRVHHFPFHNSVKIDAIYCRDASIATDFGMILCNMGKVGRKNEPALQRQVYTDHQIPILGEIKSPGTLEGGDVAWLDEKTLAVGHTYRTNEEGIRQLKSLLEPKGISILVAELPHYKGKEDVFHLMSILSPVDKNLAVVYSPLMPIKFRNELIQRSFQLIEVPDDELESMGCNVLALAPRQCVMVDGNKLTQKRLEAAGCSVAVFTGEEISIKGGGGPTCLTRPMLRSN
ncbi:N-dimethylarginine dimethylaminohydrolase [Flavobacteriaceae bacterium MAR_2010_72]|nr:N-dimethylarginine dimethylaminohydrolase [Flavobacteriaceae bacterium MAR_2010_72]